MRSVLLGVGLAAVVAAAAGAAGGHGWGGSDRVHCPEWPHCGTVMTGGDGLGSGWFAYTPAPGGRRDGD